MENINFSELVGGAHKYRGAITALNAAAKSAKDTTNLSKVHVKRYRQSDGQFPYLPTTNKRVLDGGTREISLPSTFILVFDIIGSTDSAAAGEFKSSVLDILKAYEK